MKINPNPPEGYCACGEKLHYLTEFSQNLIEDMIKNLGTHIDVFVEGKTYSIPRHFIALHGIKGNEIAVLGFEEIKK